MAGTPKYIVHNWNGKHDSDMVIGAAVDSNLFSFADLVEVGQIKFYEVTKMDNGYVSIKNHKDSKGCLIGVPHN